MRRILLSIVLALLAVLLAAGSLAALGSAGAALAAGEHAGTPAPSNCVVTPTLTAAPSVLLLGEAVTGSLRVRASCPQPVFPMHVVLAMGSSTRIDRREQSEMNDAAVKLAEQAFAYATDTEPVRIGVVDFHAQARTVCPVTDDEGRATGCQRRRRSREGCRLDLAVRESLRALTRGRRLAYENAAGINEIMVVFSQGESDTGCAPALAEGNKVKAQGVLLMTVCVGPHCNAQCMRQLATSPRYFFQLQNLSGLIEVFKPIREYIRSIALKRLVVTQTLAADMRYLDGSAQPELSWFDTEAGLLVWDTTYMPREGVTYTFRAKPEGPGWQTLGDAVTGWFRDGFDREGLFSAIEPADVGVLKPIELPRPPHPPVGAAASGAEG